jgi:circadian clock protein KaiC
VGEQILDELAHRLLNAVRQRGVKRLVIDGLSGFQQAALEPERIVRFWSALSNELRAQGVTTLHTLELQELAGPDVRVPGSGPPTNDQAKKRGNNPAGHCRGAVPPGQA